MAELNIDRGVVAFTAAYLLAAVAGAFWTGNLEFAFYIGVMLVLIVAVLLVHRRVRLTRGLLWGLSVWGLAHMAGGLLPVPSGWPIHGEIGVLYSLWIVPGLLKYDHLVHAYGFGVTTWMCWQGLRSILLEQHGAAHVSPGVATPGLRPTAGMLTLCAAAGLGFGALNEIVEFIAVLLIPETNVGGYANTGWDLVSNLVGAVLAAVVIYAGSRRGMVRD